jgi:peptidoglycan/LPS O-acetylase OafA/YrhL
MAATSPFIDTSTPWTNIIRYNPLVRLAKFGMGILAGRVFSRMQVAGSVMDGRGHWIYLPALILSIVLLTQAHHIPYPLMHNGLLLPLYAAIVLGLAFSGGAVARFLSLPAIVFLGNASYSMYILHVPIASWLEVIGRRIFSVVIDGPVWAFVYTLIVIAISSLVYKLFEEPVHYRLKHWLNQVAGRMPVLAPRSLTTKCSQ